MISQVEKASVLHENTVSASGALWRCLHCGAWWGSQVGHQPHTTFLLRLPESLSSTLSWDDYRGWKSADAGTSICPQCGQRAAAPLFMRR